MIKIIYSPEHIKHHPKYEIFNGARTSHKEIPSRIEKIKKTLIEERYKIDNLSKKVPLQLLKRVHSLEYINFLRKRSAVLKQAQYLYPSFFSFISEDKNVFKNKVAEQGKYSFDTYTPILKNTFQSAYNSVSVAYELAVNLHEKKIKIGYGLCRPPGHHAEKDKMGGYCYFNNVAVVAEFLSQFAKTAILDVDFHHGNGTQNIFYERADVLTISIHADPNLYFPYLSGFKNERGRNEGEGKNINYPLAKGTTNAKYQKTLEKAVENIESFKPKYLVVSLGFDTYLKDPIGGFSLTTDYYTQMAKTISSLKKPTVIMQEGGYHIKTLDLNTIAFLKGFS